MRQLILNVDDFEPQRYARTRILLAAGFEVIEASTGAETLDLARKRHPALVVLDVHLPDMDGREVCRQLKSASSTANILVLHVSATFRDAASRTAALEQGADGYLAEVVEPDELVAQVRALLRLADAEAQARATQHALRESEERYRGLFEHMTEGFFLAEVICSDRGDPVDYRYLDANAAFERLTGIKQEAAIGKTVRELLPAVEDSWIRTYGRVALTGKPESLEQFASPLGRFYSTIAYSPRPGQVACLFHDTTERRRADDELRASEERLRLAQEAGRLGVFDWDVETGEAVWSAELERMYGIPAPPDPGKRREAWLDLVHPDDRPSLTDKTRKWLDSGIPEAEWNYRVVRPDGEERWITGRSRVVRHADGRPARVIGTNIDVTESKELQQRLETQRAQLEAVFQAMSDGVSVFNMAGEMVMFNDVIARICGYASADEMRGVPTFALPFELEELDGTPVHVERWPAFRVVRGETLVDCEHRARRLDTGQEWIFSYSGRPIRDDQGRPILAVVVTRDITAQKRAETSLRESEETARQRAEELEKLMDVVPAAIWVADDPECSRITGNRAANRFYEASGGENVSAGPATGGTHNPTRRFFRDGVELPPSALPMQRAVSTGEELRDAEFNVLLPSGRTLDMLGSATPLFHADGTVRGCIGAFVDITERKRVERALQQSETRFRTVVEHSRDGINMLDLASGRYVFMSPAQVEMTGFSAEELAAFSEEDALDRVHPDDRQVPIVQQQQIASGHELHATVEYRWRVKSGEYRWFSDSRKLVRDEYGQPVALVGVSRDITERKRAEEALWETAEKLRAQADELRTILDTLPVAVFITRDADGHGLQGNRFTEEMLRLPPGNVLKSVPSAGLTASFKAFRGGKEIAPDALPVQVAARTKREVRDFEFDLVHEDGVTVSMLGNAAPFLDAWGRGRGAVGAFIDVTARKRAEEALNRANAELAEADRRKDEFLAILSHELRNPLAPIRYALPVLQAQSLDAAGNRAVGVVQRQVEHLARLVDDLLDLSRIATGKIELRREEVTIASVLSTAAEAASPKFIAGRHKLTVRVPSDPIWLYGDPARLAQTVTNLLDNSAKYTPPGGEVVLEATAEEGEAVIRVRDNGIGMPPEALGVVFDMFSQVHPPGHQHGGLGIGLALVKRLVEMHGGAVRAHSDGVGKGAEFVVRLPVVRGAAAAASEAPAVTCGAGRRVRVLIVDDNADLVEMLAMVVEGAGHEVRTALDGSSAVSAALAYRPDVVLLDLGLPAMSGIEVAKELRRHQELTQTRLIALTGWGQSEDHRQTQEAGFDHHLTKPSVPEDLLRLLAELAANV